MSEQEWSGQEQGSTPQRPQLREGHVHLSAGDQCPRCNIGVLFEIARDGSLVTLRCFNCNTTGSHDEQVGHQAVTSDPRQTPTGLTLSPAQAAAREALDPEEAMQEHLTAEQGSGISTGSSGESSG